MKTIAWISALALAAGCGGADEPRPAAAGAPHIVILLADDLGWGDVGYHGSELATPRLDRLAAEGTRLERYYASPMCTPSRAQLLTGRHAVRTGLHKNINRAETHGLPPEELTIAELLREHGYATALVGKWHLGHHDPAHHPLQQGFDHFYGHLSGWIDYTTHRRGGLLDWQRDGVPLEEVGYSTDLIAREAIRLIGVHDPARPLFLFVSFNAPHTPLNVAPGRTAANRSPRAMYATMVEALDEAVGRVVDELERRRMLERTLLFFASDNGGNLEYGASNGALRGGKFQTFEGGIRVPALLRWPGHTTPGSVSEELLTNLDLFPSLASAAGAPLPDPGALDGRERFSALGSAAASEREALFFDTRASNVEHLAVLRAPWKLVRQTPGNRPEEARSWLFDVLADEDEERDLWTERPELAAELERAWDEFEARVVPPNAPR